MEYIFCILVVVCIVCHNRAIIKNKKITECVLDKIDRNTSHNCELRHRVEWIEIKPYIKKINALGNIDCKMSSGNINCVIGGKPQANVFFDQVNMSPVWTNATQACVEMTVDDFIRFAEHLKEGTNDAETDEKKEKN